MSLARELAQGLMHLVYPGICPVCDGSVPAGEAFPCSACRAAATNDPHPYCPRCGTTVGPHSRPRRRLRELPGDEIPLRAGDSPRPLRGTSRATAPHEACEGGSPGRACGGLWFTHQAVPRLREVKADIVVPVPLHWWRAWRRGYNQSRSLAEGLARGLGVALRARSLARFSRHAAQTEQTPAGRRQALPRGPLPRPHAQRHPRQDGLAGR